jgi:hypothetical protein
MVTKSYLKKKKLDCLKQEVRQWQEHKRKTKIK